MNHVIIVAGGTGTRMGSDVPKQFLLLNGTPVMMHAIRAFHASKTSPAITVALHPSLQDQWKALCAAHGFEVPHNLVAGGNTRFESVKNGLAAITDTGTDLSQCLIAVHDAARPLIDPALIDSTYTHAATSGAAALALQSSNSVRIEGTNGVKNNNYPRERVYLMQTPQTFNGSILADAYDQTEDDAFTDDASVVEKKGYPITLVNGDTLNIKLTFAEDLPIAELLLARAKLRS